MDVWCRHAAVSEDCVLTDFSQTRWLPYTTPACTSAQGRCRARTVPWEGVSERQFPSGAALVAGCAQRPLWRTVPKKSQSALAVTLFLSGVVQYMGTYVFNQMTKYWALTATLYEQNCLRLFSKSQIANKFEEVMTIGSLKKKRKLFIIIHPSWV